MFENNFDEGGREVRSIFTSIVAATGLVIASNALPIDMPELAVKYKCIACHAIDKKIVGPTWMEISRAYNSNGTTGSGKKVSDILAGKAAEEQLLTTISQGGTGNWGTMPMPAIDSSGANQTEMRELVKFILGLAKEVVSTPPVPVAVTVSAPVAVMSVAPPARKAATVLALAKKYKCAACHSVDKEAIGPSWMEISKAYNSNGTTRTGKKISDILRFTTAENSLLLKVSEGSTGNWGSDIMPANDPEYNNEAGMRKLIKLILELAR